MTSFFNDWTDGHVAGHRPRSVDGFGSLPDGPGLGITVDAAARRPAAQRGTLTAGPSKRRKTWWPRFQAFFRLPDPLPGRRAQPVLAPYEHRRLARGEVGVGVLLPGRVLLGRQQRGLRRRARPRRRASRSCRARTGSPGRACGTASPAKSSTEGSSLVTQPGTDRTDCTRPLGSGGDTKADTPEWRHPPPGRPRRARGRSRPRRADDDPGVRPGDSSPAPVPTTSASGVATSAA